MPAGGSSMLTWMFHRFVSLRVVCNNISIIHILLISLLPHLRHVVDLPDHVISLVLGHVVQGVPGEAGLVGGGVQLDLTQWVGEDIALGWPGPV